MESSSEVLFLSIHPNYDTWFWQKRIRRIYPGKSATKASVRIIAWWPGITQDVQHFVSNCKNGPINKHSLGKKSLLDQKLNHQWRRPYLNRNHNFRKQMGDLHIKMKLLQPHHLQSNINPDHQSLHENQQ